MVTVFFWADAFRGDTIDPPIAADSAVAPAAFTNSRRVYLFEPVLFMMFLLFENWGFPPLTISFCFKINH
jgi:hypothetical protein